MNDVSSALSVAQRLLHVLDHLNLPKTHFGLRYPADLVGLHAAAAAGLWMVQVVLAAGAGFEARSFEEDLGSVDTGPI